MPNTIDLSPLNAVLPTETVAEMQAALQFASRFGDDSVKGDAFLYEGYMKAMLTRQILAEAFETAYGEKKGRCQNGKDQAPASTSEKQRCTKALRDFTNDPNLQVEFAYGKGYGNSRSTTYVRVRSSDWTLAGRKGMVRSGGVTQSHLFEKRGDYAAVTIGTLLANIELGCDLAFRN